MTWKNSNDSSFYKTLAETWNAEKVKTFSSQEEIVDYVVANCTYMKIYMTDKKINEALIFCVKNIAFKSDESLRLAYLVRRFSAPNSLLDKLRGIFKNDPHGTKVLDDAQKDLEKTRFIVSTPKMEMKPKTLDNCLS